MCTFSGTLTTDFFAPFTSDFEAWRFGIEWRATASEREKENRVKRVLDCFGTLSFTLLAMTVAQGNWFQICPPKHSHKAVRHNIDPVLRGHHYWACLRSWRFFGVFFLLWFEKLECSRAKAEPLSNKVPSSYFERLFPRCPEPLFQGEAKCEANGMKMMFCSHANKTRFHKKDFAFSHLQEGTERLNWRFRLPGLR